MPLVRDLLLRDGIAEVPELCRPHEAAAINAALAPHFRGLESERRAYAHADDLLQMGLWEQIFSQRMMAVLFALMPDPVLYHLHAYEIAANDARPHIFGETLSGWHRDPDSTHVCDDVSHVSLFVYLTEVGAHDGAFEFVPNCSQRKWLRARAPYISVTGAAGYSFVWSRDYFHRASPNRGPVRRRLLKISIQRNHFPSAHLGNAHFRRVLEAIPPGDARMDLLLGRFQGKRAPLQPSLRDAQAMEMKPNSRLALPVTRVLTAQVGEKSRALVHRMRGAPTVQAAYD